MPVAGKCCGVVKLGARFVVGRRLHNWRVGSVGGLGRVCLREVTVLGMESVPFERVLGKRLGESVKTFFESKGVKFVGRVHAGSTHQRPLTSSPFRLPSA